MTNDANWLEDVRRWFFNGGRTTSRSADHRQQALLQTVADDAAEVGYETAQPSIQTLGWTDSAAGELGKYR